MGQIKKSFCDRCTGEENVEAMTVVRGYGKSKTRPWEVDICRDCYDELLGDLKSKGRRPTINNIRPQHRFKKTDISEKNL